MQKPFHRGRDGDKAALAGGGDRLPQIDRCDVSPACGREGRCRRSSDCAQTPNRLATSRADGPRRRLPAHLLGATSRSLLPIPKAPAFMGVRNSQPNTPRAPAARHPLRGAEAVRRRRRRSRNRAWPAARPGRPLDGWHSSCRNICRPPPRWVSSRASGLSRDDARDSSRGRPRHR